MYDDIRPDRAVSPHESEVHAALALGQLEGALAYCTPEIHRVFGARVIRRVLVSALRQEGHAFSEDRFLAWFAGLVTLSDLPPRKGRPARVLCEAILTELGHSRNADIASAARLLQAGLLAPADHAGAGAAGEAYAVIASARALIASLPGSAGPSPFHRLATLYRTMAGSLYFAPPEQSTIAMADCTTPPSPRWALELLAGEALRSQQGMRPALPMPDLIRLDAIGDDTLAADRRAEALAKTATGLATDLRACSDTWARVAKPMPGRRGTSRAPLLYALLAGFGALRSRQIEAMLGASRIGVRGMLASLDEMGLLTRITIAGSHLHAVPDGLRSALSQIDPEETIPEAPGTFSAAALSDYEASMAEMDRLLERTSRQAPPSDDD